MAAPASLVRASLFGVACNFMNRSSRRTSFNRHFPVSTCGTLTSLPNNRRIVKRFGSVSTIALTIEPEEEESRDTVEELLANKDDDVSRLMKMERRRMEFPYNGRQFDKSKRWFPYLDKFRSGDSFLSSAEVLEALDPHIMETRKERFKRVAKNRSYSVCLVIEGLTDFGNVSAAFRSADALGIQSVHVVSCDNSKRCTII